MSAMILITNLIKLKMPSLKKFDQTKDGITDFGKVVLSSASIMVTASLSISSLPK